MASPPEVDPSCCHKRPTNAQPHRLARLEAPQRLAWASLRCPGYRPKQHADGGKLALALALWRRRRKTKPEASETQTTATCRCSDAPQSRQARWAAASERSATEARRWSVCAPLAPAEPRKRARQAASQRRALGSRRCSAWRVTAAEVETSPARRGVQRWARKTKRTPHCRRPGQNFPRRLRGSGVDPRGPRQLPGTPAKRACTAAQLWQLAGLAGPPNSTIDGSTPSGCWLASWANGCACGSARGPEPASERGWTCEPPRALAEETALRSAGATTPPGTLRTPTRGGHGRFPLAAAAWKTGPMTLRGTGKANSAATAATA